MDALNIYITGIVRGEVEGLRFRKTDGVKCYAPDICPILRPKFSLKMLNSQLFSTIIRTYVLFPGRCISKKGTIV